MSRPRKSTNRIQRGEREEKKELIVDIFGVTMLLREKNWVVMPKGLKPRLSIDKKTVIPPHIAFIAFEPGKYEPPPKTKADFSYVYDLVGDGKKETRFDAFLLADDKVCFEEVARRTPNLEVSKIPSTETLSRNLELCPAVLNGNSKQVIATIDLAKAKSIKGEDHGSDKLPVTVGILTDNWSEKIVAEFDRNGAQPKVVLEREVEGERVTAYFQLKENATRIMFANVPAQELMKLNELDTGHDHNTLPHLELLYDLFHVCGCELPAAATSKRHDHSHPQPGGAARCGPPFQIA